jgi:hypothetical protein
MSTKSLHDRVCVYNSSERNQTYRGIAYRGIEGTRFIFYGECGSDPEILYKDRLINSYDVDNALWADFKLDGYDDDDNFDDFCGENEELIQGYLDMFWENAKESDIEF